MRKAACGPAAVKVDEGSIYRKGTCRLIELRQCAPLRSHCLKFKREGCEPEIETLSQKTCLYR